MFIKYVYSRGGWIIGFIVVIIVIVLLVALAIQRIPGVVNPNGSQSTLTPAQEAVEAVVRTSFPNLCVGSPFHAEIAPNFPNELQIGCEDSWTQFGAALTVNVATCQFSVVSLTLASELGDVSKLNNQLPGCTPASQ